jgi:predicted ribosomally synthesized peptide with SipW-like signal peptide
MHSTLRKVLATLAVVGLFGALAGAGAFSAFSSQTDSPGNVVTAGTVVITDNDGGTALYNLPTAKPGDTKVSCIRVNYTGSLDADVRLYTASTIGALGPYVNLQIEPGTQAAPSFPSCTGFTPDAGGAIFNGTLTAFQSTYGSYASGLADNPGTVATKWVNSDAVVYRVTATLSAATPDAQQGATTGSHTITWEARNQ